MENVKGRIDQIIRQAQAYWTIRESWHKVRDYGAMFNDNTPRLIELYLDLQLAAQRYITACKDSTDELIQEFYKELENEK